MKNIPFPRPHPQNLWPFFLSLFSPFFFSLSLVSLSCFLIFFFGAIMRRKYYAASMYSEKSATSAKSSRSFLSMSAFDKRTLWKNIKNWIPARRVQDADSIGSSNSSYSSRLIKRFFFSTSSEPPSPTSESIHHHQQSSKQPAAADENTKDEATPPQQQGILLNREDSDEVIRRRERRRYLMMQRRRQQQQQQHEQMMTMDDDDDGEQIRVTFQEPSPVPRFRNELPAPPPSPPYLQILQGDSGHSVITDDDNPIIFTRMSSRAPFIPHHKTPKLSFCSPLKRGQTLTFSLYNAVPDDYVIVYKFLTSNAALTSAKRRHSTSSSSSISAAPIDQKSWLSSTGSRIMGGGSSSSLMERYFVRPSAGRIVDADRADIMLFLNQVPELSPGDVLKDNILVRWAVVQRNTKVDTWVQSLNESTRRKWLEMLVEEWPDQVVVRETRLRIRFL